MRDALSTHWQMCQMARICYFLFAEKFLCQTLSSLPAIIPNLSTAATNQFLKYNHDKRFRILPNTFPIPLKSYKNEVDILETVAPYSQHLLVYSELLCVRQCL